MNVEDSIQSDNANYTFSFEDLIQSVVVEEVYYHKPRKYHVVYEPELEDGLDKDEAYISTYNFSSTVSSYIEDFNRSDINRLKKIVSRILNNHKEGFAEPPIISSFNG